MRHVKPSEVRLNSLSEPAELRFDHSLFSPHRRQVEVKTLSSLTCRRQIHHKPTQRTDQASLLLHTALRYCIFILTCFRAPNANS